MAYLGSILKKKLFYRGVNKNILQGVNPEMAYITRG